jgi:hypothetical protein
MLKRLACLFRAPSVIVATLLVLATAGFGSTRDFGAFVVSVPVLGLLLAGALIATVWAAFFRRERGRALAAVVLIGLAPPAYIGAYGAAQWLRFIVWAPAHQQLLARASARDGIVGGWDSWGFGGEDTSSYLVVDTQDRLDSAARAAEWTREIGQTCGVWQTRRMWPKLYVVTTHTGCPYRSGSSPR